MGAPDFTDADFTDQLLALLPTGRVWPRDFDTIMRATMAGLAPTYRRNLDRGNDLLIDAFPATTVELLPEWEKSLGLPDPCEGPAPTIPKRQAQVLARFVSTGGQTVDYFIAVAASLGYPITVTEFAASRFGMRFGRRFGGIAWNYTWQVTAPLYGIAPFRFGANRFGDRFSTFGNEVLECVLNSLKPAHTVLIFNYV